MGDMLVNIEVIVCFKLVHLWIAMVTKFRVIQVDIVDHLEPVAEIDGHVLRQADEQAGAQLIGKCPIVGVN